MRNYAGFLQIRSHMRTWYKDQNSQRMKQSILMCGVGLKILNVTIDFVIIKIH